MAALAALGALAACRGEEPAAPRPLPPQARPELLAALREDLAAPRHPADGGGRGWLAAGPRQVTAGDSAGWTLVYEAGAEGIVPGGMLVLQVPPFWGWSPPQTVAPELPGYTTVESAAAGVTLRAETVERLLLAIHLEGRALAPGERVIVTYGAGPAGARADRFAERGSPFWLAVDGDGDGVRALVPDPPSVDVVAGEPARLLLLLPTTARPGEPVRLTVAVLDAMGNAGPPFTGEVTLASSPAGLGHPPAVTLETGDEGRTTVAWTPPGPGVYRLRGEAAGGLTAESNPLLVDSEAPRVLWGDLHGHSRLSDGTGTPEDYFRYARDVAGLDVAALTDHDHWGLEPLATHPKLWAEIRHQTKRFHQPGRFVTLLGYEWTSWLWGHRHVLYFADDGPVLSSVEPATDHPEELWAALTGQRAAGGPEALTFAHHSAGGPIATDWSIPPPPELEPVTEVVSVHGASEAPDAPAVIHNPLPGNFVRDALARGYRLGFIGSGDSHDGHPGLAALAAVSGGLAAILAEEATRESVLAALRARRVYATNGARLLLAAGLDGHPIGAEVPAGRQPRELTVRVVAPARLERLEVVRGGAVVATLDAGGQRELAWRTPVPGLARGEALYLRVLQRDGGAAWSSPWFGQ